MLMVAVFICVVKTADKVVPSTIWPIGSYLDKSLNIEASNVIPSKVEAAGVLIAIPQVLVVMTHFVVIMAFVDMVTDWVASASGLMMAVKLMAALIFLLVSVGWSVVVVVSVGMALRFSDSGRLGRKCQCFDNSRGFVTDFIMVKSMFKSCWI